MLEVKTVVKTVVDSQIKELSQTLTTQVKLAIAKEISLMMSSNPAWTPDASNHEDDLITQSPLE